jgi:hypothetical protein
MQQGRGERRVGVTRMGVRVSLSGCCKLGRSQQRWKRVACYLPLAALALEFVWILLLFVALIISVGDTPYVNTPDKSHLWNVLSAGPAAVGVLSGAVGILLRLPAKMVDWVFLILGTAGCAGLLYLCTSGIW